MTYKEMLENLLENEYFNEIFYKLFFDESLRDIIYNGNIDSKEVRDQIKARQILKNFFDNISTYDIITETTE